MIFMILSSSEIPLSALIKAELSTLSIAQEFRQTKCFSLQRRVYSGL